MAAERPLNPPFRAEHIGSLLRPPALLAARTRQEAGEISDAELYAAENAAIAAAVALQEEAGLQSITDGEYRRHTYFSHFFTHGLGGVTVEVATDHAWDYTNRAGDQAGASLPLVNDRMRWTKPVHVDDFNTVHALTGRTPKITLPGPCAIHFFGGRENISRVAYPDLEPFWDDIIDAYHKEIAALAEAGCTYIQLDETSLAKFADPAIQQALATRGDDWRTLLTLYADIINRAISARPGNVSLGIHLCRGNKRGHWQAEGGYDLVADILFNRIEADFYLLEYDSPRAGDFSPLRFLPRNKSAVLGLISTKTPEIEPADDLKRRIEEAAAFADIDQLALSPQCGFASSFPGNPITVEDEIAKLRQVVEVAADIWGRSEPVRQF